MTHVYRKEFLPLLRVPILSVIYVLFDHLPLFRFFPLACRLFHHCTHDKFVNTYRAVIVRTARRFLLNNVSDFFMCWKPPQSSVHVAKCANIKLWSM